MSKDNISADELLAKLLETQDQLSRALVSNEQLSNWNERLLAKEKSLWVEKMELSSQLAEATARLERFQKPDATKIMEVIQVLEHGWNNTEPPPSTDAVLRAMVVYLKGGEKIKLIREIRDFTNLSLRDAKDVAERNFHKASEYGIILPYTPTSKPSWL